MQGSILRYNPRTNRYENVKVERPESKSVASKREELLRKRKKLTDAMQSRSLSGPSYTVAVKDIDNQIAEENAKARKVRTEFVEPLKKKLNENNPEVVGKETLNNINYAYRSGFIKPSEYDELTSKYKSLTENLSKIKVTDPGTEQQVPASKLMMGGQFRSDASVSDIEAESADEKTNLAGGITRQRQRGDDTALNTIGGTFASTAGTLSGLASSFRLRDSRGVGSGEEEEFSPMADAYAKEQQRIAKVEEKRARGEYKPWEDISAESEPNYLLGLGAGAEQGAQQFTMLAPQIGNRMFGVKDQDYEEAYMKKFGDVNDKTYQVGRHYGEQMAAQSVSLAGSIPVMQAYGQLAMKLAAPFARTAGALNVARTAGMLTPTVLGAASTIAGPNTTTGRALGIAGDPINTYLESLQPEEEKAARAAIMANDPSLAWSQTGMSLALFSGQTGRVYKDARQLYKMVKEANKTVKAGGTSPLRDLGSKTAAEYMQLSNEVIPDLSFGVTNLIQPVAQAISSKFNKDVQAPSEGDYIRSLAMAFGAMRPSGKLSNLFRSEFRGKDIYAGSNAKSYSQLEARNIVENGDTFIKLANDRFKSSFGGQDGNTDDLKRVVSYLRKLAAEQFVADRQTPGTAWNSPSAIFAEMMSGRNANQETVDAALQLVRAKGDATPVEPTSKLMMLPINESLYPTTAVGKKRQIAALAKEIEPQMRVSMGADIPEARDATELTDLESGAVQSKNFYGVKLNTSEGGKQEYLIYNKTFTDVIKTELSDFADVQIIDAKDVSRLRGIGRTDNLIKFAKDELDLSQGSMSYRSPMGLSVVVGITNRGGVTVKTRVNGEDIVRTMSYKEFAADMPRGNNDVKDSVRQSIEALGISPDTELTDRSYPISGDKDTFPTEINLGKDQTTSEQIKTVGRLISIENLLNPTGIYQLPDGSVITQGIPRGADQTVYEPISEQDLLSGSYASKLSMVEQVDAIVSGDSKSIEMPMDHLGTTTKVILNAEQITKLGEISRSDMSDDAKELAIAQVVSDYLADTSAESGFIGRVANGELVYDTKARVGDMVYARIGDNINPEKEALVVDARDGMVTVKSLDDPEGVSYTLSANDVVLNSARDDYKLDQRSSGFTPSEGTPELRPLVRTLTDEENAAAYTRWRDTQKAWERIKASTPEDINDVLLDVLLNGTAPITQIQEALVSFSLQHGIIDTMGAIYNALDNVTRPNSDVNYGAITRVAKMFAGDGFEVTLNQIHQHLDSLGIMSDAFASANARVPNAYSRTARPRVFQMAHQINLLLGRPSQSKTDAALYRAAAKALRLNEGELADLNMAKVISLSKLMRSISGQAFYHMSTQWHIDSIAGLKVEAQVSLGRAIYSARDEAIRVAVKDSNLPDSLVDFWKNETSYNKAKKDAKEYVNAFGEKALEELHALGLEFFYYQASTADQRATVRLNSLNPEASIEFAKKAAGYIAKDLQVNIIRTETNAKLKDGTFMSYGKDGTPDGTNTLAFLNMISSSESNRQMVIQTINSSDVDAETKTKYIDSIKDLLQQVDELNPAQKINYEATTDATGKTTSITETTGEVKSIEKEIDDHVTTRSMQLLADAMGIPSDELMEGMRNTNVEAIHSAIKQLTKDVAGQKTAFLEYLSSRPDMVAAKLAYAQAKAMDKNADGKEEQLKSAGAEISRIRSEVFNDFANQRMGLVRTLEKISDALNYLSPDDAPPTDIGNLTLVKAFKDKLELLINSAVNSYGEAKSFYTESGKLARETVKGRTVASVPTQGLGLLDDSGTSLNTNEFARRKVQLQDTLADTEEHIESINAQIAKANQENNLALVSKLEDIKALFESGAFESEALDEAQEESGLLGIFSKDVNALLREASAFDLGGMFKSIYDVDDQVFNYLQSMLSAGVTDLYRTNSEFKTQWKSISVQMATTAATMEGSNAAARARVAETAEFLTEPVNVDASGRITLQGLSADSKELRPDVASQLGGIEADNSESPIRNIDVTEEDVTQIKPVEIEEDLKAFVSDAPLLIQDAFNMDESTSLQSENNPGSGTVLVKTFVGHNRAGVQQIFEGILRNSFSGRGSEYIETLGGTEVGSHRSEIKNAINGLDVLNMMKMDADPSKIDVTDAVKGTILNNWIPKIVQYLPATMPRQERVAVSRKFLNDMFRNSEIRNVADVINYFATEGSRINFKPSDAVNLLIPRAGHTDIDLTKPSENHAYRIGIAHAVLGDKSRTDSVEFKSAIDNRPALMTTTGSVASRYGSSSLYVVPVDMNAVDVKVAAFMRDSYSKIDKSGLREEDIRVLNKIEALYADRASGSIQGDSQKAIRLQRDVDAARSLAAGLADMYDMFAYGHATRTINRELQYASEGTVASYADIISRVTGSDTIVNEFRSMAKRMSVGEALNKLKSDGILTDKQVRFTMVYQTARHKKDFYQNIAQTHFTDWAWLKTAGTKIGEVTPDGQRLYGYMTKIRRDEALMNLVAIGKGSSNGYRSAFTLAHEVSHVLIDSLDPVLQSKFMETLFPDNMSGSIIDPLNKSVFTLDDNPYAVMRAQIQAVKRAVESKTFTTLQDAWKTDPRLINYSDRWHTAGHEMGVTGILNFALRNDFVISNNDAASIDYDMMSVMEQVSGPLNAFARQIMKSNPTDFVSINGAPRAVWISDLPVISYTTTTPAPKVGSKKAYTKERTTRPFISMRRNDFIRFSVTPQMARQVGGLYFGPDSLAGGMVDPAFNSTANPAHMGYGYPVEYTSGTYKRDTFLPVDDAQGAAILADISSGKLEGFIAPQASASSASRDPGTNAATNTFNGQVVGMIVKTRFENLADVEAAGFVAAFRTQDAVNRNKYYWWVKSSVEGDNWFTPRAYQTAGSETADQRGANYQTAVTEDYAYVAESPMVIHYKEPTSDGFTWKQRKVNGKFVLGQTALTNQSMQAKMMGNTGGYDAKFSNLIYNMNRKFSLAQYNLRGNLRFRDQQALEQQLSLGVSNKYARNYSLDPQLDLATRLGAYMGSEQQRVVNASGIDYGARISAGSRVFKNSMWNIMKQNNDYFTDIGYLTEEGEAFIGRINDALVDVSGFISNSGLYRHNENALNSVRRLSSDAPVVLVEKDSREARALRAFHQTLIETSPDAGNEGASLLYAKQVFKRIYDVMNNFDPTGENKGMSLESISDILAADSITQDAASYFDIDVDGESINILSPLSSMFSSGLLHINDSNVFEVGGERLIDQSNEFDQVYNDTILNINRGLDITSNNRLDQGATSVAAGHVMNLLFKHVYSKPSQQKDFLQRLQSEDLNVRARAFTEVQAVALLSDLQSREVGRALYNWQNFKLIGDSFVQKNNVIIQNESGASFRVSLNDNSVVSVSRDPFTGTWVDRDYLADRMPLYSTEARETPRKKAEGEVVEDITQEQILSILSGSERSELSTNKSIVIARPMSITDLIANNELADQTSGLRFYQVASVRRTQSMGDTKFGEKMGITTESGISFTATELSNPYKSVNADGSNNQDIASQNPRLLIDTVFKNDILDSKQRDSVGNKKLVPMQVHIAKLLTSQEIMRGMEDASDLQDWMDKSKSLTTIREAFFEAENGSVYKEVNTAVVKSNEGSTWMSAGNDSIDVEDIMPDNYKKAMYPGFDIPEHLADDPIAIKAYNELQVTRFLREVGTVPSEPKNLVIHNDDSLSGTVSSVQVKGDTLYVSIPSRIFEETSAALFSSSISPSPSGPTPTSSVTKLAPGQMTKTPWFKTKRGKAVSSALSSVWVELTSIAKAMVLNYDFGRTFIQNYALTSMNPKNALMQFYGIAAMAPNLPFGSTATTGKGFAGKLIGAIAGHRKLGAFGDKAYHNVVQGLFSKYGTPGNNIRLGILPFGPKTEVFGFGNPGSGRAYTIDDLTQTGLVTDYGEWYSQATELAMLNGTDIYDYAIQNTTSETFGSGILTKLLPLANPIERGNSLSTDILRIKTWLEYAAKVDSNILLSPYKKMKMKQDMSTHINAMTGAPSGSDPALKPVVKGILDFGRTAMSAPQWHKSQAMQSLLPAFISMGLKATANKLIMGVNKYSDPLGIGDGWVDNQAEKRFFSMGPDAWVQTAKVLGNMAMQTTLLGLITNMMSQYIENRRFLNKADSPTDWYDFATIFGWNHSKFANVQPAPGAFTGVIPFTKEYGGVRLFNSIAYDLPQSSTFFNRSLVAPFQRTANANNTQDALKIYFEEVAKTLFWSRLTSLVSTVKTAATGKTYLKSAAMQQSKGYDVKREDRIKVPFGPTTLMDAAYRLTLGEHASELALTMTNVQYQSLLNDIALYDADTKGKGDTELSDAMKWSLYLKILGVNSRYSNFAVKDIIKKKRIDGLFYGIKEQQQYPNASDVVNRFGVKSLLQGIPDSAPDNPVSIMYGYPSDTTAALSKINKKGYAESVAKTIQKKVPMPPLLGESEEDAGEETRRQADELLERMEERATERRNRGGR
jgi:hypothetical protein